MEAQDRKHLCGKEFDLTGDNKKDSIVLELHTLTQGGQAWEQGFVVGVILKSRSSNSSSRENH